MRNSQLITVDISGLDLALGGGIWTVHRMPETNPSATLLIRGLPGSGKTAFGTLLAGALGRALEGDVAYGCVELLPVELQAQHENLRPPQQARERILVPPFPKVTPPGNATCRIFAGLLELGASGEEQAHLGRAVNSLLEEVTVAGGRRPSVLVIDSLSDGYGLGSSASRPLADALSKLAAEQGLVLILLEETVDSRPSTWSFTADVVLELASGEEDRTPGSPAPFERRVTVIKNRFGPSDAGPHRFELLPSGLHVFPRPTAYLAPWARHLLAFDAEQTAEEQSWNVGEEIEAPAFRDCVTAVHGPDASAVFQVAMMLGRVTADNQPYPGITLFVDFMRQVQRQLDEELYDEATWVVAAGSPYLSGHRLLALIRHALGEFHRNNRIIEKVVVGDMRSLRSFWNPEGIRRAVGTLAAMLRQACIPLVLFETAAPRMMWRQRGLTPGITQPYSVDTGEPEPAIVDFADVVIEVTPTSSPDDPHHVALTVVRTGQKHVWTLGPSPSSASNESDD